MEAVCVKLDKRILKTVDKSIREHNYSTRTDFIREAIRDKLRDLQKDRFMKEIERFKGSAKVKVSDERLEEIREKVGRDYAKKFGIKLD
ncbi:MAG TPA: ribbon-helix-helix domain-containing protein [Candidatus Nanoarchaeia archaeon]|nr:ribbon-helix-helix domain-containing protein [Candidatus Nanoarchaeia archaeon]